MARKKTSIVRAATGYNAVLADVVALIDAGRRAAVRASNVIMTATDWGVGRRIVEEEQRGASRAEYGEQLIPKLSRMAERGEWAGNGDAPWLSKQEVPSAFDPDRDVTTAVLVEELDPAVDWLGVVHQRLEGSDRLQRLFV